MSNEMNDEIIEEIRRRREAHAASFGYDLKRIMEDLRRLERESGTPRVERSPRQPRMVPSRSKPSSLT